MVVFVSTQDSVEFCYNLFQKAFCNKSQAFEWDSDFVKLDNNQPMLELFKLHGDMPQKVLPGLVYYAFNQLIEI